MKIRSGSQKKSFSLLVALALLALAAAVPLAAQAQDVPPYLVHQGRLMDALNTPVNGAQELTFSLYTEETGGTAFWTETQTVLLTEGFYSVTLGQGQSLDLAQFSGETLFLGVTVGGEELTPRLAMQSVPYAIKSGVAQNVTGDITPTSITVGGANGTVIDASGVSVGGNVIIDASGEWSGPAPTVSFNDLLDRPFTFNDLNCSDGEIPQVVGGAWTCTPASAADTLSGLGCAEGEIPAFVGGLWTCATNTDTTYAPGTGITITILAGTGGDAALTSLTPVADLATWREVRAQLDAIYVHPAVATYALDVVDAVRARAGSAQPLSTRAALALQRLARARALDAGRSFVEPDDLQAVAVPVLAHRIVDATNDDLPRARAWVAEILRQVTVPPVQRP